MNERALIVTGEHLGKLRARRSERVGERLCDPPRVSGREGQPSDPVRLRRRQLLNPVRLVPT
ncbi:Uncharacterised protein [Mycobacteroides abscessus subsp. abscessus]|nr:Uncharacterised protein [Mycobacteroides abscessus subsp. abscessus]